MLITNSIIIIILKILVLILKRYLAKDKKIVGFYSYTFKVTVINASYNACSYKSDK